MPDKVFVLIDVDDEVVGAWGTVEELLSNYSEDEIKQENYRVAQYAFEGEGEVKATFLLKPKSKKK